MTVELGKRLEDEFEENEDDTCEVLFTGGRQEDEFGVLLQANEDDTCDVFTGGRKMRVDVDPRVPLSVLRPSQEVWLNDELNAVIGWTL